MNDVKKLLAVLAVFSLLAATACEGDSGTPATADTAGGSDTVTGDTAAGDTAAGDVAGESYAWLWIAVDSTGNECYGDADIEWKGSFVYDAATNMITFDGSWTGPYVPLYDDGPLSAGGHEAEGQTAGDHILSALVKIASPEEEATVEYGVQTKEGGWIWTGAQNGKVVIPAGSTDTFEATGMAIAAAGDVDLKMVIDTAALDAAFPFDPTADTVQLKGTFTQWDAGMATISDDGVMGDDAADDGKYTYVLSENVAGCAGLLMAGATEEFVYMIKGVEYKDGNGDAIPAGVTAYTKAPGGAWEIEVITMIEGGMGSMNTGFVVGDM